MELSSVVGIFGNKAPLNLAESWDNVGLLVEPPGLKMISSIFFTNDLTEAVLEEAVSEGVNMIYCYHPPIFSSMKSLTMNKWKDYIIMTCIQKSIAVYSPHTACDSVQNGVNDWLIGCFDLSDVKPIKQSESFDDLYIITCMAPLNYDLNILRALSTDLIIESKNEIGMRLKLKVEVPNFKYLWSALTEDKKIQEVSIIDQYVNKSAHGAGRVAQFKKPITITDAIKCVKDHLQLQHIRISFGKNHSASSTVKSVAVCAGSGASVLRGVNADLYVSGEMSHHDLLEACHRGTTTILCEHSNSERGYLKKLVGDLGKHDLKDVKLIISQRDKDPVDIV